MTKLAVVSKNRSGATSDRAPEVGAAARPENEGGGTATPQMRRGDPRAVSTVDAVAAKSSVRAAASIPKLHRRMLKSLGVVLGLWPREIPSNYEPGWVHPFLEGAEFPEGDA